jgi:hypothetical protein
MENNVIVLANALPDPDTLPELAKALRLTLDRDSEVRAEWIDIKLELIKLLVRARRKFPVGANIDFSDWLARNDLGEKRLNKNERAAAINLGQDLALARQVLEESNSWSLRYIWEDNQGRYNDDLAVPYVGNSKTQETAGQGHNNPPTTKPETERLPDLVKKFGEKIGRVIYDHFGRNTRTTQRLCNKLRKPQAATLAEFLRSTPDLPTPANSDQRLDLNTLWREAPKALGEPAYTIGLAEGEALLKVIADWPTKIAPVIAAWREAGKPADVTRWYSRQVPQQQAAPTSAATVMLPLSATMMDRIAANAEAAATPRPDPTCRASHQGPIRHHGVDIWPVENVKYSFAEAWAAMTIWRTIDAALRVHQASPKTRAAGFFKPFIGCFRNLNPAAGAALDKILHAQYAHPEATGPEDNQCPPYDVIQ